MKNFIRIDIGTHLIIGHSLARSCAREAQDRGQEMREASREPLQAVRQSK
jgi:hypothetical protein